MTNDNTPTHDATRRPKSIYAAGPVSINESWPQGLPERFDIPLPITMVDEPQQGEMFPDLARDDLHDPVAHPKHYTQHPSGIECIQITEHMGFCLGNAVKYIWRADLKGNSIEDLKKAVWYIEREIERRSA
jgi:Protein of unknwon function (DUF3310)